MPTIGATDPADLVEAKARAELGFSWQLELEQPRRVSSPPRFGGSVSYPVWYREQQLERLYSGEAIYNAQSRSARLAMGYWHQLLGSIS